MDLAKLMISSRVIEELIVENWSNPRACHWAKVVIFPAPGQSSTTVNGNEELRGVKKWLFIEIKGGFLTEAVSFRN